MCREVIEYDHYIYSDITLHNYNTTPNDMT